MNLSRYVNALVLMSLLLIEQLWADSQMPALQHDPFQRPVLSETQAGDASARKPELPTGEELDLRAILVDGDSSLVNVGGQFVRIGEQAEGYQLMSVHEGYAVFMRNKHKVIVPVWKEKVRDAP